MCYTLAFILIHCVINLPHPSSYQDIEQRPERKQTFSSFLHNPLMETNKYVGVIQYMGCRILHTHTHTHTQQQQHTFTQYLLTSEIKTLCMQCAIFRPGQQ
jgi:hypothetical protein